MVYLITLIVLVSLFLTGCIQPGIQAGTAEPLPPASIEPAIKTSPAQTDTELPTKAPPSPLQITATPYQAGQVLDLAYADRLWALVSVYEHQSDQNSFIDLILEGSNDEGVTWETHSIPAASSTTQNDMPLASRVAFLNRDIGWVYDPGLFETQDGGQSWKEIQSKEKIHAILPADNAEGQNWALAGTCAETGQDCTYHLLSLDSQSGTLIPLSGYAPLRAGLYPQLARLGRNIALVFAHETSTEASPSDRLALWITDGTDSGWKKLVTPCSMVGQLSLSPDGLLWLECGIMYSGSDEAKGIYVSSNEGATWEVRFATGGLIGATPPSTHPLQVFGNVTDMLAISKEEVLIGLSHDALYNSVDGGRDWEQVIPPLSPNNPVEIFGWKLVRKPGSDELWAEASTQPVSTLLFRSTDRGKNWTKLKTIWP